MLPKSESVGDLGRRARRSLEPYLTTRRIMIFILVLLALLLYLGPSIFRRLSKPFISSQDDLTYYLNTRIREFQVEIDDFDAVLLHNPPLSNEPNYLPYVGNGYIATSVTGNRKLHIKGTSSLSLPINFFPVVEFTLEGSQAKEISVIQYKKGLVHRFQCWELQHSSPLGIDHVFYAHRTRPNILVQEIVIYNPSSNRVTLHAKEHSADNWFGVSSTIEGDYKIYTGKIKEAASGVAAVIASTVVPASISVEHEVVSRLRYFHVIHYESVQGADAFAKTKVLQRKVREDIEKLTENLREEHEKAWMALWQSGFSISYSKAPGALNGDKINATMYYVLSNSRAPISEVASSAELKNMALKQLVNTDNCYNGHHTLHTSDFKLWGGLGSEYDIAGLAALWFLTLEKQQCHQMLTAGADGVLQAMILSFGGFRYSNHDLCFFTHPKDLHRNYHFRRILYGNGTHINITVIVREEDNKAVLYVALDRKDKSFWGCDAGCIDAPVELGAQMAQFPVKLTDPLTAILYIAPDKQHIEDLKHAIHVKEIVEAPAHGHQVIALHKHGHHLSGLPALFWASIAFLIIIFHLFLFKLIYNEYCGSQDKFRSRYYS